MSAIIPHARQRDSSTNYTQITTSTYAITLAMLKDGINIFGVTYNGAVAITIPTAADPNKLLYINREANSGTITITGV